MKQPKKSKNIKYLFGVEITKPFSKEMYSHNDKIAEKMKANILHAWTQMIKRCIQDDEYFMDREWNEDEIKSPKSKGGYGFPELVGLQKGVCYSGYGGGYSIQDVCDEFESELDTMANWQLHEQYSYMCFESLVPRTRQGMVGFGWEKMNYWTDDEISNRNDFKLERIKNIGGDDLSWSTQTDINGDTIEVPYIKAFSKSDAESKALALRCNNVDAVIDYYESDDGDEYPGGPPIILKFWSVKILNY